MNFQQKQEQIIFEENNHCSRRMDKEVSDHEKKGNFSEKDEKLMMELIDSQYDWPSIATRLERTVVVCQRKYNSIETHFSDSKILINFREVKNSLIP
jgi:hypothetical protein